MEKLAIGARKLGIELTPGQLRAFEIYRRELKDWNRRFNLTAIDDDAGILIRHFVDSLSCLPALWPRTNHGRPQTSRADQPSQERAQEIKLIDVGAGAGFPGLPLKIVCPQIQLTLLEATGKKVKFLEHLRDELGLVGVSVLHGRAEELGQDPTHREQYDWALARAVAEMPVLAEYLLPLVRLGGICLAQKGEGAPVEVQGAERAFVMLGGQLNCLVPVELHGVAETRYLVLVSKVAPTPTKYPRRPGMPSKRPLR